MRVGIDIDGVVYDFAASLREYLYQHHGWDEGSCTPPTRWEFYEDWGLDLPSFIQMCSDGVAAGFVFTHGSPYPGTHDAWHRIRADGHTIHVITDRNIGHHGASEKATRAWLDLHDLPFDSLTFTADKTVVKVDTMVDDKLANYLAMRDAGVRTWLLDRPWNQDHLEHHQRVASLSEYATEVLRA